MVPTSIRRQLALGCLVLLVGAIFIGGGQPGAGSLFLPPWDKVVHLLVYGTIALLAALVFPAKSLPAILLIVLAIGTADEIHQMFLPGRQAGFDDWLADLAGGLAVLPFIARIRLLYHSPAPVKTR